MPIEAAVDAIAGAAEMVGMSEPKSHLVYSGAAGAIIGAMIKDPRQAAIWSGAAGAAMPALGKEKITAGNLALSIVTSTAVGLITNAVVQMSQGYTEKEKVEKMIAGCGCNHGKS